MLDVEVDMLYFNIRESDCVEACKQKNKDELKNVCEYISLHARLRPQLEREHSPNLQTLQS